MICRDLKSENYLKNNSYVENFVTEVENSIKQHYSKNFPNLEVKPIEVSVGGKYVKLIHSGSVWGFISRYDGIFKGFPVRKGDLLKAAGWNSPAAHSRGNIVDGTASYSTYGPSYLR
jgi:hypothetical protein